MIHSRRTKVVTVAAMIVAALAVAAAYVVWLRDAGDVGAGDGDTAATQDLPDPTARAVGDPIEVAVTPEWYAIAAFLRVGGS